MRIQTTGPLGALSLLILTALPGCDNVEWGGADVQVVPAPPPAGEVTAVPDAETFATMGLPTGTVLFHVTRGEEGSRVVPVAEVSGDSLRALRRPEGVAPEEYEARFREAVLEPGAQLELFRRGAPVGTLTLTGAGGATACGIPTAVGNATTVAAAADVDEFLAFRKGLAPEVRGEYSPPQVTRSMVAYASLVAEKLILQAGLPRPRSWTAAQEDLQPVEVVEGGNPEMAATYLVGDDLEQGPASEDGYSVFYVAGYERRSGYTPLYSEVHNYAREGKEAPRLLDYLDWDEDEEEEILLQVFGAEDTWYETVARDRAGRWVKAWEGPRC